jgi:hypothetical protein
MKKEKAYFAHSLRKYNSAEEEQEFAFILDHFKGDAICPNRHLEELGGIEPYLNVIETTSAVFATDFNDYAGSGVFYECAFALSQNIPVYVVRKDSNNTFYILPLLGVEKTEKSSLTYYGRLITENSSQNSCPKSK